MECNELKLGDFIIAKYGFDYKEFYVCEIAKTKIKLGNRKWLNSGAIWIRKNDPMFNDAELLCHGKFKYWTLLLPFIKDMIPPYRKVRL